VWEDLINHTSHPGYDPAVGTLMAYDIEAKAINIMLKVQTLYEGGLLLFTQAAKAVQSSPSKAHLDPFEELDRVLTFVWAGKGNTSPKSHWSNSISNMEAPPYESKVWFFGKEEWNIATMSIEHGVGWYLDARLSSIVRTANERTKLLLFAYTLSFQEHLPEDGLPIPKPLLLESVLSTGISPNTVLIGGSSVWQWAVEYFHGKSTLEIEESTLDVWIKALKLMLDHGPITKDFCPCDWANTWCDILEGPIGKVAPAESEVILSMIEAKRKEWWKGEELRDSSSFRVYFSRLPIFRYLS
jgi:hypothetical protein